MTTQPSVREKIVFALYNDRTPFSRRVLDMLRTLAHTSKHYIQVVELEAGAGLQPGFVPVFLHGGRFTRESKNGVRTDRKRTQWLRAGSVSAVCADLCIQKPEAYEMAPACVAIRKVDCAQLSHGDFAALASALENAVRNTSRMARVADAKARSSTPSKRAQRAAAFKARSGKYASGDVEQSASV